MQQAKKPSARVILRLLRLLRPYRWRVVAVFLLIYATLGADLLKPAIIGWTINYVTQMVSAGKGSSLNVVPFVLLLIGTSVLRNLFRFRRGLTQTKVVQGLTADLRCKLYEHIQRLSFEFHGKSASGELIARCSRDVERIRRFFAQVVFSGPEVLSFVLGSAIVILSFDVRLAAASLSMVPLTVFLIVRFAHRIRPVFLEASDTYDEVTRVLQENIAGARVVRAFGKEPVEITKFRGRAGTFTDRMINAIEVWAHRMPVASLVFATSIPITLLVGGILVTRGQVGIGQVAACLLYLSSIADRMRIIGRQVDATQAASASSQKIFALLDERPSVRDSKGARPLGPGPGRVVFEGVGLRMGNQVVLNGIDLAVEAGLRVAIVGRTGCGKSSLVALLSRFYDPTEGRVLIDGQDIRHVTLESLRRNVATVFQDTFLFSATVAENIAYGRPEASMEEIVRSAKAAGAHEFISNLSKGYETVVGERGVTLSGGQKQRIAIARAILSDPRVLILDDATASVDSGTERIIHKALLRIAKGRTTFIIAQRISTVQDADRIVVLEGGRIVQTGTHEELVRLEGIYRRIYEGQRLEAAV